MWDEYPVRLKRTKMKEETPELKDKADSTGASWSEDKTTIQNHLLGIVFLLQWGEKLLTLNNKNPPVITVMIARNQV